MRYATGALVLAAVFCLGITIAHAQGSHPILDRIAQRVVEKYQTSSCEQLAAQRAQRSAGTQSPMEQRFVQAMRQNPQMRQAFLNQVAGPIANKLFECGMIP
jgi:hypothetical protein